MKFRDYSDSKIKPGMVFRFKGEGLYRIIGRCKEDYKRDAKGWEMINIREKTKNELNTLWEMEKSLLNPNYYTLQK
jgi:hypothetical protein